MKQSKKLMVFAVIVLVLAATTVTAFAASKYSSPAEAVADLTNRTVEDVVAEKQDAGTTYGSIAKEAGVLDEFKAEMSEMKKDRVAEKVADGTMTQDQADALNKAFEERQAVCDGTGSGQVGKQYGAGFGRGPGYGLKRGPGNGQGRMAGNGACDGSCLGA
jgi:hypothetical protein